PGGWVRISQHRRTRRQRPLHPLAAGALHHIDDTGPLFSAAVRPKPGRSLRISGMGQTSAADHLRYREAAAHEVRMRLTTARTLCGSVLRTMLCCSYGLASAIVARIRW